MSFVDFTADDAGRSGKPDGQSGHAARLAIRAEAHTGGTAGVAHGYLQCNLIILEGAWAADFARFCLANPAPCPVVGLSAPGDPSLPLLGADIDIRTDVPRYIVYRDGGLSEEADRIDTVWTDASVAFALGCSFTFEQALLHAGLPLRHIEEGKVVPMFKAAIDTTAAGPFSGPMVVSMRPMAPDQAREAVAITADFEHAHGAPVHIGDPQAIGVSDLSRPDWGEAVTIGADEVPVFWACGVTPQAAIERARPPLCIAHKPGHMLISDLESGAEAMRAYRAAQQQLKRLGSY